MFYAPIPGRRKAAIVAKLLAESGADFSLLELPEEMQADLIREVGNLGEIDPDDMAAVVEEFIQRIEKAGSGGIDGAVQLLEAAIAPAVAQRLRGLRENPWPKLEEFEAKDLAPLIEAQATEVGAVILTNLSVDASAAILGTLPGESARRLAFAVSKVTKARKDAVDAIGSALVAQLEAEPPAPPEDDPAETVGEILNFSRAVTRDDVLEGLEAEDAEFAAGVRRSIFTFGHIYTRVEGRDVPKFIRDVPQETLLMALAGATTGDLEASRDFIFASMSQRMADMLKEELAEMGEVDPEEADAAMGKIVQAIRARVDAGEIKLLTANVAPPPAAPPE
ncbi:MAG: FliG C-terminal domain-containing protein [Pseudomonadota bacterium]